MVHDLINAVIFGAVQGATEFIPVSSSGHLVLLHQWLDSPVANSLAFDSFLHLGTLGAVVWYYFSDLSALLKREALPLAKGRFRGSIIAVLAVATVPAAVLGYLLESRAEAAFRSPLVVAAMMVAVGVLFLWIERRPKKVRPIEAATPADGFVIGLAQAVALIPGTSRSGITIVAGLGRGLSREAAVKFTFLLSIPIIAGASILGLKEMAGANPGSLPWAWLAVSFFSAFTSGLWAIKFLVAYLKNNSLAVFAYYRFLVAAVILLYTFVF